MGGGNLLGGRAICVVDLCVCVCVWARASAGAACMRGGGLHARALGRRRDQAVSSLARTCTGTPVDGRALPGPRRARCHLRGPARRVVPCSCRKPNDGDAPPQQLAPAAAGKRRRACGFVPS
jgi:hypothetical protein